MVSSFVRDVGDASDDDHDRKLFGPVRLQVRERETDPEQWDSQELRPPR